MRVLLMLIAIDIITGTVSGYVHKNLASKIGLLGLIKHSIIVIIIIAFQFIANEYNLTEYVVLLKTFYFIQYSIGIIENLYSLGIPVPDFLVDKLKKVENDRGLKQWEK